MKKFWMVLLSLGLIMAFSMSAFALTADMTGVVYYRGFYIDNPTFQDKDAVASPTSPGAGGGLTGAARAGAISTAKIDQRIRLYTRFKVADGLDFELRMDWVEDLWQPAANGVGVGDKRVVGTEPVVALDVASVRFRTMAGTFLIGPQVSPAKFGTGFMDSEIAKPGIIWLKDLGALRVGASWQKEKENAFFRAPWAAAQTDKDSDIYTIKANFDRKKGLDFGGQLVFVRDASGKTPAGGSMLAAYALEPYVIAKFGPVNLEAEGFWSFGDHAKQELPTPAAPDVKSEGRGLYMNAKVNMGPAYVGANYIYMSGDDPATPDKREGNMGAEFGGATGVRGDRMLFGGSPTYYSTAAGPFRIPSVAGPNGLVQGPGGGGGTNITNLKSYGLYGGYSLSKKLSTEASVWLLKVDKAQNSTGAALASDFISDDIGKEFAATATYKLFDNLAVRLDFAYLWTGDYFKGTSAANRIANNYLVVSQLLLNF